MKSAHRTKEEIAQSLRVLAQEIALLNEFPDLPKNAKLEKKLDSHSSRWRSLYNEAASETFVFATKLEYPQNLYSLIESKDADKLVGYCAEPLLKVVYRRFSRDIRNNEDKFDSFAAELEKDLKREFQFFIANEKKQERRMGMGFSDQNQRILNDYNRFKESFLQYRKDKRILSEQEIQKGYISTHNRFRITFEKLREVLVGAYTTSVQKDSDLRFDETDEEYFINKIEDKSIYRDTKDTSKMLSILHCLEKIHRKKQKRSQKYYGALMTQWFLETIRSSKFLDEDFFSRLHDFSFVDGELLHRFELDGSVPDRQTVLQLFPVCRNGTIQLDKNGNPKYKDKGRASNDMKGVLDELKEMLEKGRENNFP